MCLCGDVWLAIVLSLPVWQICFFVIVMSIPVCQISEFTSCIMSCTLALQVFLFVQIHPWVNFESLLQKCLVGQLVQSSKSAGTPRAANKTTNFIRKLFAKRGRTPCCTVRMRVDWYLSTWICSFQLAFTNVCCCTLTWGTLQLKCDGTRTETRFHL